MDYDNLPPFTTIENMDLEFLAEVDLSEIDKDDHFFILPVRMSHNVELQTFYPRINYEETEWNSRIRRNNFKIAYNPKMKIWHRKHGSTLGSNYNNFTFFYHWRGKLLFIYKTTRGFNQLLSLIYLSFIEVPLEVAILIKNNKVNLISPFLKGFISGYKRIVQL